MTFSSSIFLLFFLPFVLVGTFLIKPKYNNGFLLVVSLLFYAWGEPRVVAILIISIFLNYLFGILLDYFRSKKAWKKGVLFLTVIANLGILFYYKYFLFVIMQLGIVDKFPKAVSTITLPIGISFYTFQSMSYIFDLYANKVEVQKNPFKLALYVCLFPQLIAGPIVRYIDIANEIDHRTVSVEDVKYGISRFTIGLAKKTLIANNVAIYADLAFSMSPNELSTGGAWLGIICYTLQIYFDFSGYSDMAIGIGRIIGFHFLENFNLPYIADSMQEFWRRWHISLSTWFRDYLYIPLGGNRKGNLRTYLNLLIVFSLCGIWHGAEWTFLIWGLFHGFFLMLERIPCVKNSLSRSPWILKRGYSFLVVMIGWVFFRAESFSHAIGYIGSMFGAAGGQGFFQDQTSMSLVLMAFVSGVLLSMTKIPILLWDKYEKAFKGKYDFVAFLMDIAIIVLLVACIVRIVPQNYNPFIYFRF